MEASAHQLQSIKQDVDGDFFPRTKKKLSTGCLENLSKTSTSIKYKVLMKELRNSIVIGKD